MAGKLRVAQIGVGGMGRAHVAAVHASDRAELVAVADSDPDALAAVAGGILGFESAEALFAGAEFDALIAVLPHDLYPDIVDRCSERGVHLLKEKPFARNLADAERMHAAVTRSGIRFLCAAQRQYTDSFTVARGLLDDDSIGRVFLVEASILYCWHLEPATWGWRGRPERSGGIAVIDSGWHILDAVAWLKGLPAAVYCRTGSMRACDGDYAVDDKAVLALDFDDGAVGSVTVSYVTTPSRYSLLLHGVGGTLEIDGGRLRRHPRGSGVPELVVEDSGRDTIAAQFEHFVDVVLDGAPPRVGIDQALALQRVVDAAYRSAASGERVIVGS